MIATLAKHWRKLLGRYTPEELGLDLEFSYPAALSFLEKFKALCQSIETFGYPILEFPYQKRVNVQVGVCIPEMDDKSRSHTIGTSHNHTVET
eukprot:CAMPEP_0201129216 /NCGR_PEP_ID=MMETSP0850-20130426/36175_1 /ASSEMBLY_ACC=CAM_ASM_000622 /TAXON_ID=183588 /ORGANISM="Pseudo-nitzschia fraudulenta, Strain WWA7" /LENGTH=92 /DNA_ID=CAMNT_0047398627 /DNA_START=94 /DNA_END=369 /DNA_ORIENTATION=-